MISTLTPIADFQPIILNIKTPTNGVVKPFMGVCKLYSIVNIIFLKVSTTTILRQKLFLSDFCRFSGRFHVIMDVDVCGDIDIFVPHQFLNGIDVNTISSQLRSTGMS